MTNEQLDRWASEIRQRDHGTTHWDGCEESHPRCRELALIARVRELEAERDEWRALTITPRGAQYYIDKAAQAEAERDRLAARVDKAEDHAQQVSAFAAKMIGHACERHADTIQRMSFNEFYREMPRSCHWCADERVTALEADRDRLAAEVERLRVAARDFLTNHWLDCGAHYCRYCPARSPEWNHDSYCAYVRSQSAYTALWAAVTAAPAAREEGQ